MMLGQLAIYTENDYVGSKPYTTYKNKFQKSGRPEQEKWKFKHSWSMYRRIYDFGVRNKSLNKAQMHTL